MTVAPSAPRYSGKCCILALTLGHRPLIGGGYTTQVHIREYTEADWPAVWSIFQDVVTTGDTFPYDPAWSADQAHAVWVQPPPYHTVVACEGAEILGTAHMGRNRPGPGAHVATASFMVAGEARGQGVGRALSEYALTWAREQGFAAMQFNAVVESNTAAVRLYQTLGFQVIGTVPQAFKHPRLGLVGLHVMHCFL